jgi:hypothetical protein
VNVGILQREPAFSLVFMSLMEEGTCPGISIRFPSLYLLAFDWILFVFLFFVVCIELFSDPLILLCGHNVCCACALMLAGSEEKGMLFPNYIYWDQYLFNSILI